MTDDRKLRVLQTMLGEPEENSDVLSVYLDLAGSKILNRMYPFKDSFDGLSVPDKYTGIQLKIAAYMLNKRGAEGEVQHIENGIHRNYGDADIPEQMLADIAPFAKFVV